jgi:hypothetical protein
MLLSVILVRTDVSEERIASIIRVIRIGLLGTTLAVNSTWNALRRNTIRMLYFTTLHYITLYHTIPYYTILYHTIPYYTILYYTIPYYSILFLCSFLRLLFNANVVPSLMNIYMLMMEKICSSETSVYKRATQRHIPEDGIHHVHTKSMKIALRIQKWKAGTGVDRMP